MFGRLRIVECKTAYYYNRELSLMTHYKERSLVQPVHEESIYSLVRVLGLNFDTNDPGVYDGL